MSGETKQPGGEARPSAMSFGGDSVDNIAALTWAQAIQRLRLQQEHGLNPERAALIAGLAYGEVAA